MKHSIIYITGILGLIMVSCSGSEHKELLSNPEFDKDFAQTSSLILEDSIDIKTSADISIEYMDSHVVQDSIFLGVSGANTIDVYNLKTEEFLKTIKIHSYELNGRIMNISATTLDSIYVQIESPPQLIQIDYEGHITKKYKTGLIDLALNNPLIPTDVVNYSFPSYVMSQKPLIIGKKAYMVLQPLGLFEVEGLRETQRIGVLNLETGNWEKAICPPKGIMAEEGVYFNYDLMNPYFTIGNNEITVSYPMDHWSYVYDLNGTFKRKHIMSASQIQKFLDPLDLRLINEKQEAWNYRIQTPFYGPVHYHQKSQVYSRVFYEQQPMYESEGMLNSGKNRSGYVLIFDLSYKKIGEVEFENASLSMAHISPLSDGLLIGKQNFYWDNENRFIQKYMYSFKDISDSSIAANN